MTLPPEGQPASSSILQALKQSRRDVLDLSLRNPLLNFRPGKRRGLEVVDERSRELFGILVRDERVMYFLPAPEGTPAPKGMPAPKGGQAPAASSGTPPDIPGDVPAELLAMLAEPAEDSGEAAARHTDNKLQTALTLAALNLRLRETFRQARLSMEEQGVNILYLALGALKWYESGASERERRAPLILIPVQLAKSGVRESFKLTWAKDEIEANLSLEAKLRQDFDVRLPGMPSEEDLDVEAYLTRVEEAVAKQPRWSVERDEIHLNFFSFSKLLIYKDLDAEQWPEGSGPADHPLMDKLFGDDGFAGEPPETGGSGHIDEDAAAQLHPVLDADGSQTLAVLDAINGRNLVIQGPPGTGKSQTITNLIGEALARGRTVLFVAEKMAALEVVKRRLDTVHLGDACLELHSHKTNKRAVLDELRRTLKVGRPQAGRGAEDRVLLEEARIRLNDYARAVNQPVARSELTPQELVGRLAKLGEAGLAFGDIALPIGDPASWSREEFIRRREVVREMQELVRSVGSPREHAWWPCGRLHFLPTDAPSAREAVEEARAALRHLERETAGLRESMGLGSGSPFAEMKAADIERMIRTARRAAAAPALSGADHRNPGWVAHAGRIAEVAEAARSYAAIRSRHDAVLIPEAWELDVLAERQALRAYGDKWWRFLPRPFREARRKVRGICRGAVPATVPEQIELLDAILEAGRIRRGIGESRDLISGLCPGLLPDDRAESHLALAEAAAWLVALRRDEAAGRVDGEIHDLLDHFPGRAGLEAAADACERAMRAVARSLDALGGVMALRADRFAPGEALENRSRGDLDAWLRTARGAIPSVHDVVRFNQLEKRAAEAGIPEVAEAAASRPDAGERLTGLFEHACYAAWLNLAFGERPVLAEFDGATHAGIVARFRELDVAQFRHNQALIAERHWDRLPREPGGGQLGVLKWEFQKKRRHMAVRRLMREAGRAIQSIKPVFMMSPLSIAKYIPPGSVDFDLVVFDEASQVRPVEALGAIIRGGQTVVVGDSRQLPPTSFFDRMAEDDDEDEENRTADMESILGMFCAKGAPERMLRWHYRSRHESLIAVSNHEFYDNRLVVFPSPDARRADTGLVFSHHPEAPYERKGVNGAEAKTVALAAMEHARAAPDLTLGVAAFSNTQARRIEDEVDILRRRDPSCEKFFSEHPEEPFFVKNLENVQGDERDVILISIGYGKIDGAYLPMNFGPLNREGGERRLNVLITRARRRCVVYSNFVGADLDLRRSKAVGVRALKTFLEYARTGILDVPGATGKDADSPFEEAVAARLRTRGHDVAHQIGSAGFFVDLAVVDPARPGRYLLGIECDGAAYHSSRSARDRDRLRQQVLEGLGWRIHRIWSTDWFRDPERELDKVDEAVRTAKTPLGGPPVVPARKPLEPFVRDNGPSPEVPAPSEPYMVAEINDPLRDLASEHDIDPPSEILHAVSTAQIADWIGLVVKVESPVHLDEVTARVCRAIGARVSSRIRARLRSGAREGVARELFEIDSDGFLWSPGPRTAVIRRRDGDTPASLRDPSRIPAEEIGAALVHAARVSYGIAPSGAVREAVRLFGFSRTGSRIDQRFRQVMDQLLEEGALVRDSSFLRVPPDEAA